MSLGNATPISEFLRDLDATPNLMKDGVCLLDSLAELMGEHGMDPIISHRDGELYISVGPVSASSGSPTFSYTAIVTISTKGNDRGVLKGSAYAYFQHVDPNMASIEAPLMREDRKEDMAGKTVGCLVSFIHDFLVTMARNVVRAAGLSEWDVGTFKLDFRPKHPETA